MSAAWASNSSAILAEASATSSAVGSGIAQVEGVRAVALYRHSYAKLAVQARGD